MPQVIQLVGGQVEIGVVPGDSSNPEGGRLIRWTDGYVEVHIGVPTLAAAQLGRLLLGVAGDPNGKIDSPPFGQARGKKTGL